jgi:hypothetical protein
MAVVVSGDGGWAGIDRDLGEELAREGLPVVGLNSLQYFWKPRDAHPGRSSERCPRSGAFPKRSPELGWCASMAPTTSIRSVPP